MGHSQAQLAGELAVTEQTVSLWERNPTKRIPKTSDRLLRLLAEAWLDDHQSLAGAFAQLRQASRHPPAENQRFQRVASSWQAPA
jgi:transcriptional regulator with XRE-family HTH domain